MVNRVWRTNGARGGSDTGEADAFMEGNTCSTAEITSLEVGRSSEGSLVTALEVPRWKDHGGARWAIDTICYGM